MGFKTFNVSDVLTASDVNTYLMKQAVITCTSSTRPASPVEGMTIYQTDTDNTWVYDGATWMPNTGLQPIKPTSVVGGTATANAVTASGSSTTLSLNGVFSSAYDIYRILIDSYQPATATRTVFMRMRSAGTDASGADYYYAINGAFTTGTGVSDYASAGQTGMTTGLYNSGNTTALGAASIDLFNPYKAERTYGLIHQTGYDSNFFFRTGVIEHNLTTAYDGFTLYLSSTGNITTLRVRVYGYR